MSVEPTTILGSQTHIIDSQQTGRTYRVSVSLPLGYDSSPDAGWPFNSTPDRWPVVYVLDGNWYFGMVTDMIRPTSWCGSITDAIVVGIGYPVGDDPIESFRTSFTRRDHDLTPIRDEKVERSMSQAHGRPVPNGDALNFHKFIRNELIPFIEQGYRADPARRILVGHSYGGLFALFGLFETPDLFNNLIVGSPTLSYGNHFILQREEAFARDHKELPASVFLYAAELEELVDDTTLTDTLRLAAILESRAYENFKLVKRIFLGENHCEVATLGFHAGLKLALKK